MKINGQLVDIHRRDIYPAVITILGGRIESVERTNSGPDIYILPGLIDSHIHISEGYNGFDVIRSATINPSEHYDLEAGMLRKGDSADFILVDTLKKINV